MSKKNTDKRPGNYKRGIAVEKKLAKMQYESGMKVDLSHASRGSFDLKVEGIHDGKVIKQMQQVKSSINKKLPYINEIGKQRLIKDSKKGGYEPVVISITPKQIVARNAKSGRFTQISL